MAKKIDHVANNREQRRALSAAQGREMHKKLNNTQPGVLPRSVSEKVKTFRHVCWDN